MPARRSSDISCGYTSLHTSYDGGLLEVMTLVQNRAQSRHLRSSNHGTSGHAPSCPALRWWQTLPRPFRDSRNSTTIWELPVQGLKGSARTCHGFGLCWSCVQNLEESAGIRGRGLLVSRPLVFFCWQSPSGGAERPLETSKEVASAGKAAACHFGLFCDGWWEAMGQQEEATPHVHSPTSKAEMCCIQQRPYCRIRDPNLTRHFSWRSTGSMGTECKCVSNPSLLTLSFHVSVSSCPQRLPTCHGRFPGAAMQSPGAQDVIIAVRVPTNEVVLQSQVCQSAQAVGV